MGTPLQKRAQAGAGGGWPGKNNISASAWFDGGADYLRATVGAHLSNRKRAIGMAWCRRSTPNADDTLVQVLGTGGSTSFALQFKAAGYLEMYVNSTYNQQTVAGSFRDTDWYPILWSYDSTVGTASDRMRVYLGHDSLPLTGSSIVLNADIPGWIGSGSLVTIGQYWNGVGFFYPFKGSLSQVGFFESVSIQNGDYAPSDFFDAITAGTNGTIIAPKADAEIAAIATATGGESWFLSSAIGDGTDDSANANNFTPTSMSDAANGTAEDTPSSPGLIWQPHILGGNNRDYREGAASFYSSDGSEANTGCITTPMYTGKWNIQFEIVTGTSGYPHMGILPVESMETSGIGATSGSKDVGQTTVQDSWAWNNTQILLNGASQATGITAPATNQRVRWEIDVDAGLFRLYLDNVLEHTETGITWTPPLYMGTSCYNTAEVRVLRGADADETPSDSAFVELTPAAAYAAMNTSGYQGTDYHKSLPYAGDGAAGGDTQALTGAGFAPDWAWIKGRDTASNWRMHDKVRGTALTMYTDLSNAEATDNGMDSFDSDGITVERVGASTAYNHSSNNYFTWLFKGNGAGVSNTDGTVTSTVSASPAGHFSFGTFTAPASGGYTFGHGLDGPNLMIIRPRNTVSAWYVTSDIMDLMKPSDGRYLAMDVNSSRFTDGITSNLFPSDCYSASSSTFKIGTNSLFNSSNDMMFIAFKRVPGVCWIGQYYGNSSTDGPYIPCGLAPEMVIFKTINTAQDWYALDRARADDTNVIDHASYPDISNVEGASFAYLDMYANGFKLRSSNAGHNQNTVTYLYIALADVATGSGLPPIPGR
jgi:hypothetical protein